jgi:hypothetical protein
LATQRLIFGILCNSLALQKWQANAIKELLDNPAFEAKLIVVNANTPKKEPYYKKIFSSTLLFRQYENRILKVPAKQPVDMAADLENIPQLKVKTLTKGKYSQYFSDEDITTIKAAKLDFIIRFGFGILKGEILNAATYGVWSYHHGDEQYFKGGPPGFWEIFYKKSTTATILQQLTPTLDGGIVLKKGHFKTLHHSYQEQLDVLFTHSSSWIKQVGLAILNNGTTHYKPTQVAAKTKIHKAPKNLTFIAFLVKLLINKLKLKYASLTQTEIWNIGILQNPISDVFERRKLSISWIPGNDEKALTYRADPFTKRDDDTTTFVFEKYDYQTLKGHIGTLTYDTILKTYDTENIAYKPHDHLSYPFTFTHNGNFYCIPECYQSNKVELYTINANNTLENVCTLIEGLPVVDPTLLYYNNKFWLFFTIGNLLHNAQLHIYYSNTLEGPYKPHQQNPVKTDITSARPAGNFFYYDDNLIRPAQNCSHTYGGSLVLNKVIALTETQYIEEKLIEIYPFDKQYNKGIHHLCVNNDVLTVDGKKYIFSLSQLAKKLLGK